MNPFKLDPDQRPTFKSPADACSCFLVAVFFAVCLIAVLLYNPAP